MLFDLGKPLRVTSFLRDNPLVRADKKKDFTIMVKEAENFFKHADRDPDKLLKFRNETTQFYLFDATSLYAQITKKTFHELVVMQVYFAARFPHLIEMGLFTEEVQGSAKTIDPENYQFFLEMIDNSDRWQAGGK